MYVKEIWSRLPELLAASTTVYGSILKIDSTKKVCKKLQGAAINSASWCTNVGNEYGEVLISVLTESEGLLGLKPLADGLVQRFANGGVRIITFKLHVLLYIRYRRASKAPPILMYTDRDCCNASSSSKLNELFIDWDQLLVRFWRYGTVTEIVIVLIIPGET